jgi:hypothetical protein
MTLREKEKGADLGTGYGNAIEINAGPSSVHSRLNGLRGSFARFTGRAEVMHRHRGGAIGAEKKPLSVRRGDGM